MVDIGGKLNNAAIDEIARRAKHAGGLQPSLGNPCRCSFVEMGEPPADVAAILEKRVVVETLFAVVGLFDTTACW